MTFKTFKTSDLCDACDAVLPCQLPFRGFGRRRAFAGAIRTVRCHEDVGLIRDTVHQPGHGQVLVVDGGGSLARAIFGDILAAVAVRNGWQGLVVHGVVRDAAEIDGMDLGVKALGTLPRRGEKAGIGEVDVVVHFGGVDFRPGDYLVADEDGVIVLPPGLQPSDIAVDEALGATAAFAAGTA